MRLGDLFLECFVSFLDAKLRYAQSERAINFTSERYLIQA
jgi:hypothetical protein